MEERFRLQPVLNYRQKQEEARQQELARLKTLYQQQSERLQALEVEKRQQIARLAQAQQTDPVDLETLLQVQAFLEWLDARLAQERAALAALADQVEQKRRQVVAAMQDRKILEQLAERHARAYRAWLNQREARQADEVATIRAHRRRQEGADE
jgi:flagellar FliJ protein